MMLKPLASLIVFLTPAAAQDFAPTRSVLPEVMLIRSLQQTGWVLSYTNQLSSAGSPDAEVQTRELPEGIVSWRISRSRNNGCLPSPCPDSLQILSVPDGYIAVPQAAEVDEEKNVTILIVPNNLS